MFTTTCKYLNLTEFLTIFFASGFMTSTQFKTNKISFYVYFLTSEHLPGECENIPLGECGVDAHDGQGQVDQTDLKDQPNQRRARGRSKLVRAETVNNISIMKVQFPN